MTGIILRPGRSADAPALAQLLWRSDSGILAGVTRGDRKVLEQLIRQTPEPTIFSAGHMTIAERGPVVLGALFGYDRETDKRTRGATFQALRHAHGTGTFIGMLPYLAVLGWKTRISAGDYYISNVAVVPAERGQGIGSLLLDHAETGRPRVALDVAEDNTRARRLYERRGYAVDRAWHSGGVRYLRMLKPGPA